MTIEQLLEERDQLRHAIDLRDAILEKLVSRGYMRSDDQCLTGWIEQKNRVIKALEKAFEEAAKNASSNI